LQSGKDKALKNNKSIDINLNDHNPLIADFYLEKNRKGSYVLNVLGINGESLQGNNVLVSYTAQGS
jgi:hypothetical protein